MRTRGSKFRKIHLAIRSDEVSKLSREFLSFVSSVTAADNPIRCCNFAKNRNSAFSTAERVLKTPRSYRMWENFRLSSIGAPRQTTANGGWPRKSLLLTVIFILEFARIRVYSWSTFTREQQQDFEFELQVKIANFVCVHFGSFCFLIAVCGFLFV